MGTTRGNPPKPIKGTGATFARNKSNVCQRGHDLKEHGKWADRRGRLTRVCMACRRGER